MKNQDKIEEPIAVYANFDDSSIYALIEKVKNGLSFKAFSQIAKLNPFKFSEWASFLHLSDRTMHIKKKTKLLIPFIQKKFLRLVFLLNMV